LAQIPNPQSPNPQSPIPKLILIIILLFIIIKRQIYLNNYLIFKKKNYRSK